MGIVQASLAASCTFAALSGFFWSSVCLKARADAASQRRLRKAAGGGDPLPGSAECGGFAAKVLDEVQRSGRTIRSTSSKAFLRSAPLGFGLSQTPQLLARAGLADAADEEALRAVRLKEMLIGAALGALAGIVFSPEMSAVLCLCGLAVGYACVPWALKREAKVRNAEMERHLSEMIEVVVLGLRSGLSFERSFSLYPQYFDTGLSRAMKRAAGQWEMGLHTREEALRRLEAEYDSALLSRVVGSMVRSLRFGTSIVESLETSACEAREVHRALMEERVAKVAVKMMLPVGTLILPAMLLLVLGPVLLELVEGF